MQSKTDFNFIGFLILLFIAIWALLFAKDGKDKYTKQDLASYYGISKPTLAKWMVHFQEAIQFEDWNKRRFLTADEFSQLLMIFSLEQDMVMSKKTLAHATSSNYKVLSMEVLRKLDKINISELAWKKCSAFPPVVSNAIVKKHGRTYGGGLHKIEPKELLNVDITSLINKFPQLLNLLS